MAENATQQKLSFKYTEADLIGIIVFLKSSTFGN